MDYEGIWQMVKSNNPECENVEIPDIRWTSGDVPEIPYGVYIPQMHTILLNGYRADRLVLIHEMLHACRINIDNNVIILDERIFP